MIMSVNENRGGDSQTTCDILGSLPSDFQIIQLLFKKSILPGDTFFERS